MALRGKDITLIPIVVKPHAGPTKAILMATGEVFYLTNRNFWSKADHKMTSHRVWVGIASNLLLPVAAVRFRAWSELTHDEKVAVSAKMAKQDAKLELKRERYLFKRQGR